MRIRSFTVLCAVLCLATPALASETVTYSYDALGRLTKVQRGGTVNAGVEANYGYDAADNRSNVTVTGSSFGSANRVFVVPLKGLFVVPIGQAR